MIYRYYRIRSLKDNKNYIGKTKLSLDERLKIHYYNLSKYLEGKTNNCGSFQIITDGIQGVDYIMELINEFDIDNTLEARIIEQIYIDEEKLLIDNKCCNISPAYSSKEQKKENRKKIKKKFYDANKEKIKKYYEANREHLLAKQKEYNKAKKAN